MITFDLFLITGGGWLLKTYYTGIQYLRGVAAISVIVYHAMVMQAVSQFFPSPVGNFGVDVFFVISGFIMWVTTTTGKKVTPGEFFRARLFRVFPLYWFFTWALLIAIFTVPSAFLNQRNLDIIYTLKSFFLIPARNPDVGDVTPLYTIGWTLVYEMFFYVVFALALFFNDGRHRLICLASVFCALVLIGIVITPKGAIGVTYTSPVLLEFLSGIMIGVNINRLSNLNTRYGFIFLGLSIMCFVWGYLNEAVLSRVIAFGPGAILLVVSSLVFEKRLTRKPNRVALLLGGASYSMYLAHPIAQRAWYVAETRVSGSLSTLQSAVIYSIGAVVVGIVGGVICYFLIEKPGIALGRKVKQKLSSGAER
ncbi:acyltransferase [Enterobacteriaceae bacterium ESL0689]|nr:acyltransferase [Enterobacteriaceae bacterium ESL0689]